MNKKSKSPPAISISKAVGASLTPLIIAQRDLLDVFNTPSPKANDGITLNIQDNPFPYSLVDSINLRMNIINGPMDPTKKWMKNEET